MLSLSAADLAAARAVISPHVSRTPSRRWPQLETLTGTETWVKHENHCPTGAYKVRGGLNLMAHLAATGDPRGVVSASRGNHSQSLAFAGAAAGRAVTIVVPEGNSPDKNAATEAFGARLIVHGADFQDAVLFSRELAGRDGLLAVPAFQPQLVTGVATYVAELHEDVPGLDVVYVPIGMGSGVCANVLVRDLLGISTEIVGVVAAGAPAYALSFEAGRPVSTPTADTFVDGVACREPDPAAVAIMCRGVSRVVRVSERDAAAAMCAHYRATHNLAEPAGSLALAAAVQERDRNADRRVAVIQTGGNADFDVLSRAFATGSG